MELWYDQYGAALVLFGIALTGDRSRAQDAVHQAFLKLLECRDLDHISTARTYLFVAVRNTILNHARRGRHDVPIDEGGPWFERPNRDYLEELSVRRALAGLQEDQREVIILHIWGGLTFAEVAEVLGINASTAASRYRYALAKLRQILPVRTEVEAS